MKKLVAWLQQRSPLTITIIGLCCALALGIPDRYLLSPMSFISFHLAVVVFVGWGAGKWHALLVSGVSAATMAAVQWGWRRNNLPPVWVFVWNHSMRFVVLGIAGWLTAEVRRLTHHLSELVEERTAQWKAEVEQHKATSARLGEAVERFEQVINNITEVFWLTNVSKNEMAYISPGYERVWGRKCEELYREPKSWAAAVHPADRDEVVRHAQTNQAVGGYDVEYRILRPDGAVRWIRDRAFPVRNERGEVYRIAGLAEDITERKRTREVLQTQAAIVQNMAEGVVVTDDQGLIVQVNSAGERIWGYEHNEVLGQPASVLSALPEPEARAVMLEVLAALQATGGWRGTFQNRRKDGALIYCEAVISRLEVQGRRLMVAVEQDVTERLVAQEQLQMQARVLESMAEAVLLVDEGGTIVLANPALEALLGYERGELLGQPMLTVTGHAPEEHRRDFQRTLGEIKARGSSAGEYLARRKDGSFIEVETRSSGAAVGGRFHLVVVGQDVTERKQSEQALRQGEATLRAFLDAVPTPALLLDRDGAIVACNDGLVRRLGLPSGAVMGKNIFDLLPHGIGERRQAVFDEVVRSRQPAQFDDFRAGHHFMNFANPVLDAAGNVTRVAVLALDITERKRAETALREAHDKLEQSVRERTAELEAANTALRQAHDELEQRVEERTAELQNANAALTESEERYRSLVNNLNVGVYRNKPGLDGGFVQANPALARMHGYDSVAEFQRVRVADLYQNPRDREQFLADLRRHGTVLNYELKLKKRDGTAIHGSVSASGHLGPNGEVEWIDGVLEDVTERKRAQEALRASEERYRTLAESSPEAIFILDRDIKVQYVNSAAAALWLRQPAQLIGLSQAELFPPETAQYHCQVVAEVFKTGKPVHRDEPLGFPASDQWIEIRLAPLYGEQGTVIAVMGVCRDITERKRAERQLAEVLDLNQKMIAVSTVGIAAYRASGECVFANDALAEGVGGSVSEVQQGNFRCLESWQQSGLLKLADEALSQGRARVGEILATTRFGKTIWVDCHVAPFTSNEQAHLLLMAVDISERKRAEEALKIQSLVLQNMAEGALLLGPDQTILFANSALESMFGYGPGELLGQKVAVLNVWPPEETARFNEAVVRATQGGGTWSGEYQNRRKDGTIFTSEARVSTLNLGGHVHFVGVQQDITERKRAEEALRQSEARIRAIITGAPVLLFAVDSNGIIRFEDGQALKALGAVPGANVGRPVKEVYAHIPAILDNARRALRGEAFDSVMEAGPVVFDCSYSPTRDQDGNLTGYIGVATNITERNRLERQLLEISDREQARIGQDIHDGLCQHLVSLAFDANALQQALSAQGRPEEDRIARRIAAVLDQTITESRQLSRGLFPVRLETEGLPSALEELATTTRHRFKLRCRFASKGTVAVENSSLATHLYRIAQEAVNNAIRHSRARTISIRLIGHADALELSVEDDGVGLASAQREQAAGMGLHIIEYRARTIGGTLNIGPGRPGGTIVSCCIPRAGR
jgi:PAS domain S-box-containing protein